MSRRSLGMVLVGLSAACYGCNPILVKIALRNETGVATLLMLRYGIATVFLLALMAARGEAFPRGRQLFDLILLGALGNMVHSGLYLLALANASAASVAIILFIYPALVTLMAAMFLKERVPLLKWVAVAMALTGAMLTVGEASGATALGSACALASATWFAAYIVASSRLAGRTTTLASATVVVGSSAVGFCLIALFGGLQPPVSVIGWAAASGTAVIGTVIAISAFFAGLNRVGPVTTSTMGTLEPIVAVILAAMILREHIGFVKLLGGALVIGAVYLISRADDRAAQLLVVET